MRPARRFPQRLVRWTGLCVCLALVLTSLAMVPLAGGNNSIALAQGQSDPSNGKGRKVRPEAPRTGAPMAGLPNLDETKRKRHPKPEAPADMPSIMRSRHKPVESRRGRKVGDPGTTGVSRIGSTRYGTGSGSDRASSQPNALRSNHTRTKARASVPPPVGDDQFVQNFFY
jgi:hypothetical protein